MFKHAKKSMLLFSALYILLGLVLVSNPFGSLQLLCRLVGLVILLYGVSSLLRYSRSTAGFFVRLFSLLAGILCSAVGAFLLITPDSILGAVPVLFGLFIIFDSLVRLVDALQLRKTNVSMSGMVTLAALSALLGLVMVLNPFKAINTAVIAIGAVLIVEGVLNLCSVTYTTVQLKAYFKAHPEVLEGEASREPIEEGTANAVDVEFHEVESGEAAQPADTADTAE